MFSRLRCRTPIALRLQSARRVAETKRHGAVFGFLLIICTQGCTNQADSPNADSDRIPASENRSARSTNAPEPSRSDVTSPTLNSATPSTSETGSPATDDELTRTDSKSQFNSNSNTILGSDAPVATSDMSLRAANSQPPTSSSMVLVPATSIIFPPEPKDAQELRQQAQQIADELITIYPQSADAQEVKARFHLLLGETDAAKSAWERALEIDPTYPYALHGMGKVGLLNADFDIAVKYLQRARSAQPDSAEVIKDLSRGLTKQGNVQEATSVLQDFVDRNPDSTETFVLLGQAFLSQRMFEQARDAFERALELYPELPHAQQGLGTALIRLGDRQRAKELLEAQANARQETATNRTPAEVFRDELTDYATRFVFASHVYIGAGNMQRATDTLLLAVACDATNSNAWTLLLDIQQQLNNLPNALKIASEMCQRFGENPSSHYTRGILQAKAGQTEGAAESFKNVIDLAPSSPLGLEAIVRLNLQTQKELQETLTYATTLTEIRGSAGDYDLLGQTHASLRDFPAAKAALEKAIELDPNNQNYKQAMTHLLRFMK